MADAAEILVVVLLTPRSFDCCRSLTERRNRMLRLSLHRAKLRRYFSLGFAVDQSVTVRIYRAHRHSFHPSIHPPTIGYKYKQADPERES